MLIVILGPSCAGKDTCSAELKKILNFDFIALTSSRPKRDYEKEGDPYFFVSKDQFENYIKNNELIEHRSYDTNFNGIKDTWYYGIHKNSIDLNKNYIVPNTLVGLKNLKNQFKDVISFYLNVDEETRTKRAKSRDNFDEIEWNRRLIADAKDFQDFEKHCDYVINNNNLENTIKKIINKIGVINK